MNTPIKVLYLEDDPTDRRAFLRMVREKNLPYVVTTAETLADAQVQTAQIQFDVIVVDYHLPDGHGTDLIKTVPDVPFILLTGTLEEQLALRTLERGADDYLPKSPGQQHLDVVPFTVEKCLHRKLLREKEQQLSQELARANADLERKVSERTARLQEAMAELEHMSYSIVHDLRAPLRAIQSLGQILVEEAADRLKPEEKEYLQRIRASSSRMDQLIRDVLNYNQMVKSELPIQPVEVEPLLRSIIQSYPQFAPAHADICLDGAFPTVLGNQAGLTQCFSNLLANAVKFVAPGTRPSVRIWAQEVQGKARIWIQDNGIGIPRDAQNKIFRMFQKMHAESEYPGTGMGLAIVRKAVQRMGGQAGLESEPGKGSRFWLELPKAAQTARLAA